MAIGVLFYAQFHLVIKISHLLSLQVTLLNFERGKSESWNGITENSAMGTWSLSSNKVQKKRKPRNRNRSISPLVRRRPQDLLVLLVCEALCSFHSSFLSNLKLKVLPSSSRMKDKCHNVCECSDSEGLVLRKVMARSTQSLWRVIFCYN